MKSAHGFMQIGTIGLLSGAAVLLATDCAIAAAKVTGVQLSSTATGINLVLKTEGSDRPQVFSVNRGNTWTADLVNTRLQLPGGSYQKSNPAAGIASVSVLAIDNNSVRVTVVGQTGAPTGQINRAGNGNLSISLKRSTQSAKVTPKPSSKPSIKSANLGRISQQGAVTPAPVPLPTLPNTLAQAPPVAPTPASPLPPFQGSTPMLPNPNIKVEGRPYTPPPPVPPFAPLPLPRAVAPPVGDMAVGQVDTSPTLIDLGTAERVPRLVLRDASAREALALLARAANLNIVFTGDQQQRQGQQQQQQQQQGQTAADGPKVTLDIVNEPVQNVFNYVLQITGLEANRRGNTIFVGPRLPNSARNIIVRSVRLNQVPVATALPFLVTLGAESAVSRERLVTAVNAVPITNISQAAQGQVGQQQAITQSQTTTEQRLEVQRVEYADSTPILRGLQVSGDERTNTVTLVGEARKVEIALAQLTQLDIRRRQVAVNVRVIDVDLLAFERLSSSFSFGVNDTQAVSTGGVAILNFGQQNPSASGITPGLTQGNPFGFPSQTLGGLPAGIGFTRNFLLQISAAVTNGSAKVLTDPTLLVQEGQRAQVEIGEEVITNVRQTTTATQTSSTTTVTVEKAVAGLTLPISVDRIDDNGFISLSIAPLISRPQGVAEIAFTSGIGNAVSNQITLLALRRVESGQVRLRDGQSLLLTGIIQDTDRTTVTKVPILGDIPILGALFRRSETQNQRREVIVLLTPRVLDDSDRSAFGYSYTPGVETQKILQQMNPQR